MTAERKTRRIPSGKRPRLSREEELVLAVTAAGGDRSAQRRVVQMLLAKVRQTVSYIVTDPTWVDDLTQTVMLKILCSLKDFRAESSLELWSTRVAIRSAMKAVKTRRRRRQLLFFLPEPRSPFGEVHASASSVELRQHINRLVSKLPLQQQVAIRLRYVHEHSIKEIAEITEASENTVRDRLRVGKKKLTRLLSKNPAIRDWVLQEKS